MAGMTAEQVDAPDVVLPMSRQAQGNRRSELASFLRSRRARLLPQDVGLPPGLRRRTPGLRREEVAQLAGVGVTWYTWLEQGRPIQASVQVLDAVARTLGLDRTEREHLYRLAGVPSVAMGESEPDVPQAVRLILDQLDPLPATLVNARFDMLAWNAAHDSLFHRWHTVPCAHRNMLWCCFTEPAVRERFPNFDDESRLMVATLRAAFAQHLGDPGWTDFVRTLNEASPEFARLWAQHDVSRTSTRTKHFVHPVVGDLRFSTTSLTLGDHPGARVIVYTPEDEATRRLLTSLSADA